MSPRDFLQSVVQPNIAELDADFGDIRRAFNAVMAVDALAAHLFRWIQTNTPLEIRGVSNDSAYRAALSSQNADFALVRDIAKSQKHVQLTQGKPLVSTAKQVETRSLGWGDFRWGEGRWNGPPQVVVEINSGELRVVEAIVKNAAAFLESEMDRLRVA